MRGRNVVPYSAVGETGENVPALKHFFPMSERTGTIITDTKGGCVWDVAAGGRIFEFDRGNTPSPTVSLCMGLGEAPIDLASGTWHPFSSTKTVIAMHVGRKIFPPDGDTSQTRFAIGDVNGIVYAAPAGMGFANSPAWHTSVSTGDELNKWRIIASASAVPGDAVLDTGGVIINSINYHFDYANPLDPNESPLSETNDIFSLLVHQPGGEKSLTAYRVDDRFKWMYGWATTTDTLHEDITFNPCMRITQLASYGYAFFEFDILPEDYLLATTWMAQEWKRGNRVIWPGWIGKT